MNFFVADPDWGWWIVLYFFLGGIAAGCYLVATLIDLFGAAEDHSLARLGYRIAFPLIVLCAVFLIVDLERPERFWHMLFQSEVVHAALDEGWPLGGWGTMVGAPALKWWSPMSIGAWALALFGVWSFLSFLASFRETGLLARLLGRNWFGHAFRQVGSALGFFVASYTGVLLSATNQPLWSLSDWVAPLFLTSAASTAIAVLLLMGRDVTEKTHDRLERADLWALGLELFLFLIFLASLGPLLPLVLRTWQGWLLVCGTLGVGLLVPLALHSFFEHLGPGRVTWAALFALAGGFLLRFGIVNVAPALRRLEPDAHTYLGTPLATTAAGVALIVLTVILALAIPWLLRRHWSLSTRQTGLAGLVSALALAGVLAYAVRSEPAQTFLRLSPEDGRRHGDVGASSFNQPQPLRSNSKINRGAAP
jgi:formate-dependent nitrite reductase membrane component NrfD